MDENYSNSYNLYELHEVGTYRLINDILGVSHRIIDIHELVITTYQQTRHF